MQTLLSWIRISFLVSLAVALVACGGVGDSLGIGPLTPPDEFAVVTKAPLVLPPDFGLRPPAPGALQSRVLAAEQPDAAVLLGAADGAVLSAGTESDEPTKGEAALLAAAGAGDAAPGIRATINLEAGKIAERGRSFADRVIFWQADPGPDVGLNAEAEAERLRAEGMTNLPPNIGQPEARRTRGLLAF